MKLATYRRAQATMRGRSKSARTLDRRRTRNVTKSVTKWRKNPGRYDIRGVDTRRKRGGSRKRRVGRKPGPKRAIGKKRRSAAPKKRKSAKRVAAGKRLALMRWGSGVIKRHGPVTSTAPPAYDQRTAMNPYY